MGKKFLSFVLAMALLIGLVPSTVFAGSPADIDDNVWVQVPYLESEDDFSGSGTESDPYYAESLHNRGSLDQITITTANPQATINGQVGSWVAELQYGFTDIYFTVVSADQTATAYYHVRWQRVKPARPNATIPKDSLSSIPETDGNSNGKIIGLDASEHYDYKAANASEWTHISGTTEITGLSAGKYKVKYGESEEYAAASDSNAVEVTVGNATEKIAITNLTNYTFVGLPQEASEYERVDLKMELTKENQWVQKITVEWNYRPASGWGSSSTIPVRFVGYTVENGKKYYNGYIVMPSYKNPLYVEIKNVNVLEESYYSVQKAQEEYITMKVTPKNTDETIVVNGETIYKENSEVTIDISVNQGFGTRVLKSFNVADSNGNIVAASSDGSAVTVSVTDDLQICDVVTETIYADFTAMEEQLDRLKGVDLNDYTDNTRIVVEERLKLAEQMYKVTQKDQYLVDEFVPTLQSAIDGLVPKKGDFTAINDLMKQIPEDMSVYTDGSAAALTSAIAEAETAKKEEWNRLRQDEIDAIAVKLETAIAALVYKDADYSKVDAAVAKANALNKDVYKDFAKVEAAIAAVIRSKNITEQAEVDKMAEAIEKAIAELVYKDADYSKVDEAIAKANALNKDAYKDFSKVEAAIAAVVRSKNITEQAEVDEMAEAIEKAIAGLEKKALPESTQSGDGNTNNPQTGDNRHIAFWLILLFVSGVGAIGVTAYSRKGKYNNR